MKLSKYYSKPNILIISGATASGKTSWALNLARKIKEKGRQVAIINFDSLLFYKELNIGTAKPSTKERKEIDHYLIDICSANEKINASLFRQEAIKIVHQIYKTHFIILVGGSAFYLRALIKGMYNNESAISIKEKEMCAGLFQEKGITPFIDYLNINDPKSLKIFHENDHYRIIRAYQFHKTHGKSYAMQKEKQDKNSPYDFSKNLSVDWILNHHYLEIPKEFHWPIIKKRATEMINLGLIDEVENLLKDGFSIKDPPLQSIGYKETILFLKKEIQTENELIEHIFISTRQLAKAQKTFFKKIIPKETFNPLVDALPLINEIR